MIGTILFIVAKFDEESRWLICIYALGLAWCWGALGWLVPSGIFPLEIRSVAQSINVAISMLFSFVIAQVFIPMLCHKELGLLIFFSCCMVGMWIFIYVYLPEACGVPIEDMTGVFKNHPQWRKYYNQTDDLGENSATNKEVLASPC
ncbi:Sugar transport protein 1 [Euphorbia peplus]|nr:Sugar transport protein 1 [Euphorbia peplus]